MLTIKELLLDHLSQTYKTEGWYPPLGFAVKGLTAGQAAWKLSSERHSIWQIVRHVIHWKRGVLQSWAGDPPDYETLTAADWEEVSGDQVAWERDVQTLNELYDEFHRRLESSTDDDMQGSLKSYQQSQRPVPIAKRLAAVMSHDAYHAGQIQYVRALQGIPSDRLFTAAIAGDSAAIHDVLQSHPDLVDAYSRDGWTALQLAAFFGHAEVARLLLERGADIRALSQNEMGNTALHGAIAGRRAQAVRFLLDRGADPEAIDAHGNTALHLAAHEGDPEIVDALLNRNVEVNSRRKDGKTPLAVAVAEGQTETAARLRGRGGVE